MDYGLWIQFPIYGVAYNQKESVLTSDYCWDYFSFGVFPMSSDYTSIDELVSVWFYFIIIVIIEFVSDGL